MSLGLCDPARAALSSRFFRKIVTSAAHSCRPTGARAQRRIATSNDCSSTNLQVLVEVPVIVERWAQ